MKKADLVTRMAQAAEITKQQAEKTLGAFLANIQGALSNGEHVTLVGFGTFSVQSHAARKGRHPRTGQELFIPARKTPVFRAGKPLRQAVVPDREVTVPELFAALRYS